jgi:hydrophobic/amphiphilic exporter-1 (mainly G- bacteria), HAE1 family
MIASTCLAVVFVPAFFVVLQRLDERRRRKPSVMPPKEAVAEPAASAADH